MKYQVTLTFIEDLLGTVPYDKEVYGTYIAAKAVNGTGTDDELETVIDGEKGKTGFHRLPDGTPILYDYVLKGFFKDVCSMLRRDSDSSSAKLKAHKKVIDGLVFVFPRRISIHVNGALGELQRPLRAQTAQGERVALAFSDTAPAGSSLEFEIETLGNDVPESLLREWLDYGRLRGLGQWRNAGWGKFSYEIERDSQ